jgi:hypothetical protein
MCFDSIVENSAGLSCSIQCPFVNNNLNWGKYSFELWYVFAQGKHCMAVQYYLYDIMDFLQKVEICNGDDCVNVKSDLSA